MLSALRHGRFLFPIAAYSTFGTCLSRYRQDKHIVIQGMHAFALYNVINDTYNTCFVVYNHTGIPLLPFFFFSFLFFSAISSSNSHHPPSSTHQSLGSRLSPSLLVSYSLIRDSYTVSCPSHFTPQASTFFSVECYNSIQTTLTMVLLKPILSAVAVLFAALQVQAAPAKLDKRLLLPTAPLASDIDGAHLLLQNDVDSSNIIKNAYVLLSRPRGYYDGMSSCLSMGDGMFPPLSLPSPCIFVCCVSVSQGHDLVSNFFYVLYLYYTVLTILSSQTIQT